MINYRSTNVVLSGTDKDIEFLTLLDNGHLILRHRFPSGVICEHLQEYQDLHRIVQRFHRSSWKVETVPLPKSLHGDFPYSSLAGIRLAGAEVWVALFPFLPCSFDLISKLMSEGPKTHAIGVRSTFAMDYDNFHEFRAAALGHDFE